MVLRVDEAVSARPSLAGWVSGAALFAVVVALTEEIQAHGVSVGLFAASAGRIAAGKVWLLLSSALVVDRPVAVGLVAFGLIGFATLWVCGARTFWLAAIAGHIGSTLLVYAIIGVARLADPHVFSGVVWRPDFGVSAMQSAWVGALTAYAWLHRGSDRRRRAVTLLGVAALAAVAWVLHPDPSILTFEHLFAFCIGASLVWSPPLSSVRPIGAAALAFLRSAPVSVAYLLVLCTTTAWLTTESGRDVDRLLLDRSTNLDHLGRDPVRVIVASAFWLSSHWEPLLVTALLLLGVVASLERRIGSRRTLGVLAAGHVGATLFTAAGLWIGVRTDALDQSIAHVRDVGPSYAIYAAAAALVYVLPGRVRPPYLVAVLAWVAIPAALAPSFTDVGHFLSVGIGLACYPVVRSRPGRHHAKLRVG